ncbi:MAG: TetR family transcriptional regulator [Phycisphaerales bacterium]|nr:TetR family transcriptional regulator [Phycisphaerales bacterium]
MANATTTPGRPRQARAVATRQRLIDAAVASLCTHGWAGTTTTVVARRAGVSQGALYKHFGNKHQLIAAAMEELLAGLIRDFRVGISSSANEDDPLAAVLTELWAVFLTPELYAAVELYIAARTDEPLRRVLVPVLLVHRANLIEEARRLFPEAAEGNPRFELTVFSVIAAMQGAAMNAAVLQERPEHLEFAGFLEELCRRELQPPFGGA